MKNFKALTLAAITALSAIATPAAQAKNVDADHIQLGRAIAATGVELKINPLECNFKDAMGWYWAKRNELVICQENAKGGQAETNWTAEDLDTLRHEAQHLIQDCMDGRRQGSLGSVYQNPIRLAKETLSAVHIQRIIDVYREGGASNHIVVMELEAFSVAALNKPLVQASDIASYCL
tara:strand:- start:241 stop:774 length:534 start_codon:yes stop_codon:yes gene_type:complete